MTYICLHCGNTVTFKGTQDITEYSTQEVVLDGEGSIIEYGNAETNDSDVTEGPYEICCSDCGESASSYDNPEELEELKEEFRTRHIPSKVANWKEEFEGEQVDGQERL